MPRFKKEQIGFKISNALRIQLEQFAAEKEMSVAEFLRYLIQKYADDRENKNN